MDGHDTAAGGRALHSELCEVVRSLGLRLDAPPAPDQWSSVLSVVSEMLQRQDERLASMERRRSTPPVALAAPVWPDHHLDAASGLPNRRALLERLGAALAMGPEGSDAALVVVHLGGLPRHDERLTVGGPDRRSAVVAAAAERVRCVIRDTDLVGRVAPDRLAVVLGEFWSPLAAATIARRMERAFTDEVMAGGGTHRLRPTAGAALARPGSDPSDVFARASTAVEEAVAVAASPRSAPVFSMGAR
jgi:GGDEF domain-containing protein